jgi:hypothetical protein
MKADDGRRKMKGGHSSEGFRGPRLFLSFFLLPSSFFLWGGCSSPSYSYKKALRFEEHGEWLKALRAYRGVIEDSPRDPLACQARVRAGRVEAQRLMDCAAALADFSAAARDFPALESCVADARAGLMSCPDFFPLEEGLSWTYGDSQSRGRNMRLIVSVRKAAGGRTALMQSRLYAGRRLVRDEELRYEKSDWRLVESRGGRQGAILRYPFTKGMSWENAEARRRMRYLIVSTAAAVSTRAGRYSGCLKVRAADSRFPGSWEFRYYAPFTGLVKTTIGGKNFETPHTELLGIARK